MLTYALLALAGALVNRTGAKWARSLPDDSKLKKPAVIIFGGPPPRPPV